jgi:peptidoglycan hydrolase-like protein with peptidoglycan-binding domain
MDIYEFHRSGKRYTIVEISADEELTTDIQTILIWLKLLDPPVDGKFGPITTAAFKEFQELMKCPEIGVLDTITAKKLIETDPTELPIPTLPTFKPGSDLAGRIIKYMQLKNYHISAKPGEYNIVYVEGMNADGTENTDAPNQFNDRRIVIEVVEGIPKIVGNWEATTEPGRKDTLSPLSERPRRLGAARIKFGQYKAWQVGSHKDQYPALVQVSSVTVHRDKNKDFVRTGDELDTGIFGINQHHGNHASRHDIGRWSAGCLVGRAKDGHEQFMALIMKDKRYKANPSYIFLTTIIPGDDLLKNPTIL